MFDIFDITVPRLLHRSSLSTRQPEKAFRHTDATGVYIDGIRIGSTVLAKVAYSNIASWTGSADRADWDVVILSEDANTAAEHDAAWATFLNAVRLFLEMHPHWRVTCESDCDQHPDEHLTLTPAELTGLLDKYRTTHSFPIAFWAEV